VRRGLAAAALAAAAGFLAGCASAPPVRLHTLVAAADVPATTATLAVNLRVNSVPVQVDQAQWLVRQPDDTLLLLEQERWAAPLRDELRAGLLQALAAREGVADAGLGAAPAAPRVAADVTRFESLPGREARLDASWSVDAAPAAPLRCVSSWREPVAAGAPALAEGHRRIVAKWAAALGQALRTGRCPG